MPAPTTTDQDEGTDNDKLNPANRRAAELNDREQAALRGIESNYGKDANPSDENTAITRARERNPNGSWKVTRTTIPLVKERSKLDRLKAFAWRGRRKGASATVIGILAGFLGLSIFSPMTAPFALLGGLDADFNDFLGSAQIRGDNIFRNKLATAKARDPVISGCTKLSIRCKFKTMSTAEVARFKQAGITVEYDRNVFGRAVPKGFTFRNQTYNVDGWNDALKNNRAARNAQLSANNMKVISYYSKAADFGRARFGLVRKPGTLRGTKADKINQILTATSSDSVDNVRFRQATDADGNPIEDRNVLLDINGNPVLDADGNPITYTDAERAKLEADIKSVTEIKTPSQGKAITAGALSILGYYDLACTMSNMIGSAATTAKIAMNMQLIRFSWDLISRIHQIKAGDGTAEDFEVIGSMLMDVDDRERVVDFEAAANKVSQLKENPNKGKNMLDSELIIMSLNGGVAPKTESSGRFTIGGGLSSLLGGVEGFASVSKAILNVGSVEACNFVQNPLVRGIGIVASIALAFVTVGGSAGTQVAITAGMVAGIFILSAILNSALEGTLSDALDGGEDKVGTGDAFWTGRSLMEGQVVSQPAGMRPATSPEEIVAYKDSVANPASAEYIAMERSQVSPLDVRSPYSALGSVLTSFGKVSGSVGGADILGSFTRVASAPLGIIGQTASANSDTLRTERFKQCDDPDLLTLGIAADVQCNIRYVMSDKDLSWDASENALWMEQNGYVEEETVTGMPEGYLPPDPSQSQNALMSFLKGATVGQFFADRNLPNRYAMFLDYCAYRTAPYGPTFEETGLLGRDNDERWYTGELCMSDDDEISRFRAYTMDVAVEGGLSEEGGNISSTQQGGSSAAGDVVVVSGTDQELAQKILDNTNIGISPKYRYQFEDYASGNASCYLYPDLLKLIASLGQQFELYISSLNRSCTSTYSGTGSTSLHWQGRAVDFSIVNGRAATGGNPDDIKVYQSAIAILPDKRLALGQLQCRPRGSIIIPPDNQSYEHEDTCHHIHIGIRDRR